MLGTILFNLVTQSADWKYPCYYLWGSINNADYFGYLDYFENTFHLICMYVEYWMPCFFLSGFSFLNTGDSCHLDSSLLHSSASEHSVTLLQIYNWDNWLLFLIVVHVNTWMLFNKIEPPLGISILIECWLHLGF